MTHAMRTAEWIGRLLPYKARLEYIQADNANKADGDLLNVIDTGIIPNLSTDVWVCDAQFVAFGSMAGCWGATVNRFAFGRGSLTWNDWYFGFGNTNNRTGVSYDYNRHLFTLDGPNRTLTIDGTTYSGSGSEVSGYELSLVIFNRNNTIGPTYRQDNSISRCYSAKLYRSGVLIQSLIPVLDFDDNPRLFDEVTQTYPMHYGSFTAGPEV